jgi:class 3 adenylate cyclase
MGGSDGTGHEDRPTAGGDRRIHLGRAPVIRLGALVIEPSLRRVAHDDGREEIVEPRVMQVLVALAQSGGAILTRDDLLASCWHGVVVGEDAITRVIGRLRRLADGIGEGQFKLETITKVGYRVVPLNPAPESAAAPATIAPGQAPRDPGQIALHGERRYIYAMITDLHGFNALADSVQPEVLTSVLNAYLDRLSRTVLEHGGTVDKFVVDTMVAFWGAPVARPDDGERAARAAMAIFQGEEAFRALPIGEYPPLGRTRVGLHRGDATVGAFGGEGRTTYSAVGDAMTTASGLESANRALNTWILVSREAIAPSMAGVFRPMGRIGLRGRSTPVEVFEPAPDFPPEARDRLNAAYRRFDAGDADALGEISALAGEFPDDAALGGLLDRLERVGPGGVFRLS